MRRVQFMATQNVQDRYVRDRYVRDRCVRDRYVACVIQSSSLLIVYIDNDNPKVNCYVAGWQNVSKNIRSIGFLHILS